NFAMMRFTANGGVDIAFGTNGVTLTDFYDKKDEITSMAFLPDGRILAGGGARMSDLVDHGVVAAYTTDGVLDTDNFGMLVDPQDPQAGRTGYIRIDEVSTDSFPGWSRNVDI